MPRIKSRSLYDLIKSMTKVEKRHLKLLLAQNGNPDDKKVLILFDEINKQDEFDEDKIVSKNPEIKAIQLSNLKAYLYEKIMETLRHLHVHKITDIEIREQIDFAQLLIDRRLYEQGKTCLRKAKKLAQEKNNLELQLEIIKLEKSVLMHSEDGLHRADEIITEVKKINTQITNVNTFSILALKLNSYYTRIGHIRSEHDYKEITQYFHSLLPTYDEKQLSTLEKIHLYKLFSSYYYFLQDYENGYAYSEKLKQLFDQYPELIVSNTDDYIKALNNLLIAQYKLFLYDNFRKTNQELQSVNMHPYVAMNESLRIRLLKYYYIHEINHYFMTGEFQEGCMEIMQKRGEEFNNLINMLDKHSTMIMNYKVACLYFGAGQFNLSIRYLNKIINSSDVDFREDLHCFARILNLVCHYELGNFDVIKYYIISTYRFLLKKDDLHEFQQLIMSFLKNLKFEISNKDLIERFTKLKLNLLPLVNSTYEKRAFIYFDIISWLESKIEKRSVPDITRVKFNQNRSNR
ncbi:MAG: hypothetical protein MUF42_08430 [Cytophagaceae bacterium]|jgi:hypothetical protein|nr:hypothetical protein [Cytophagaceae bacterium]